MLAVRMPSGPRGRSGAPQAGGPRPPQRPTTAAAAPPTAPCPLQGRLRAARQGALPAACARLAQPPSAPALASVQPALARVAGSGATLGAARGIGRAQNPAVPELDGSDAALPAPEPRASELGAGRIGPDPNPSTGTKRPGAGSLASRRSAACCRSASARVPPGNVGSTVRGLDATGARVWLLARLSLGAGAVGGVPSGTQQDGCKVLASAHGLALASHTLLSRGQAWCSGRARLLLPCRSAFKLAVLTRLGIGLSLLYSASAGNFPFP